MLVRTVTRWLLPRVLADVFPLALAVLFGLSQVTAMVPGPVLVEQAAELSWTTRALLRILLAAVAFFGAREALAHARERALPWTTTLPVADRTLLATFLPSAIVAVLPVGLLAFVLGPGSGLAVVFAATGAALAVRAERPFWILSAAIGAGPFAIVLLASRLGRGLRQQRGNGRPTRSTSMGWGPRTALVARDLLAVGRTDGWSGLLGGLLLVPFAYAVQSALQKSWSPAQQTSGALILLGFLAPLGFGLVGRSAAVLGRLFLERSLPVRPSVRVQALVVLGALPLAGPAFAITSAGTGTGGIGVLRVWGTVGLFGVLAAFLVTFVRPAERKDLVGRGVFLSVGLTIVSVAVGPGWVGAQAVLVAVLLREAIRRVR